MADERKRVLIEMDQDLHDQLREVADHFGASIRGTILRYIRIGLASDESVIRRERAGRPEGGASG